MNQKAIKWIQQSSEYGVATTNAPHDINNALAILMGYAENLEYMLETNDLNKDELQEICDKILYGVDKLNANSRHFASERKRLATETRSLDFSEYFHRWSKVMIPVFKDFNVIPNFVSGDEFFSEQNWADINVELCCFFAEAFDGLNYEEPQKIELYVQFDPQGLKIKCTKLDNWNPSQLPDFLGQKVNKLEEDDFIVFQFTCFSQPAGSKSAA